MDNFENNEIKIANYLEDKMSAAEEQAFMEELDNDEELRKQYEDELLTRVLLREKDAPERRTPERKILEPRPIRRTYWFAAAAAVILLIAGSAVFEIVTKRSSGRDGQGGSGPAGVKDNGPTPPPDSSNKATVAQGQTPKNDDTIRKLPKEPPRKNQPAGEEEVLDTGDGTKSERLFSEFYTTYPTYPGNTFTKDDIPHELIVIYEYYRIGNYNSVINAEMADYRMKANESRFKLLTQYMELFKGLSWLVKDDPKPDKALEQFDLILQSSPRTEHLYYDAQWYSALSLLKKDDPGSLSAALKKIPENSPYWQKASDLQLALKKGGQ